jgi:hypothetical protein
LRGLTVFVRGELINDEATPRELGLDKLPFVPLVRVPRALAPQVEPPSPAAVAPVEPTVVPDTIAAVTTVASEVVAPPVPLESRGSAGAPSVSGPAPTGLSGQTVNFRFPASGNKSASVIVYPGDTGLSVKQRLKVRRSRCQAVGLIACIHLVMIALWFQELLPDCGSIDFIKIIFQGKELKNTDSATMLPMETMVNAIVTRG